MKPQNQLLEKDEINSENLQTDPTPLYCRGDQGFFDNGLPSFLGDDQVAPEKKTPNMDSLVQVSISFAAQHQQPLPAKETFKKPYPAPVFSEPLTIEQANRSDQPRKILSPRFYLTSKLPKTSEESEEHVEVCAGPRRSTTMQEHLTSRLSKSVLEVTGQQLQKTGSPKRTNRE